MALEKNGGSFVIRWLALVEESVDEDDWGGGETGIMASK
jgi:hypothetical protein